VFDCLPIERLLRFQQMPPRSPRMRARARHLAVAQVLRGYARVRGGLAELGRGFVVERGGRFETLLPLVGHQSIFTATCFNCVYSSIE